MGLSSSRRRANAASPHGYQSTGLLACCSRYGLLSSARRLDIQSAPAYTSKPHVHRAITSDDVRRAVRPSVHHCRPCAGPCQPDRRAYRLQQRVRPPDHHSAVHHRPARAVRGRPRAGLEPQHARRRRTRAAARAAAGTGATRAAASATASARNGSGTTGSTSSRASRRRCDPRTIASADSTSGSNRRCRWGAGCRRARRWKSRCCAR